MMGSMRVYLIRHGETAWSLSGQHTGRTDLPLTPHGEEEARALAVRLAGTPFSHVRTSPRQRAVQTCAILGLDDAAVVDTDLVEWDYGEYRRASV